MSLLDNLVSEITSAPAGTGGGDGGSDPNKVDLNGNNSAFTFVNFSPSAASPYAEGKLFYDSETSSLSFYDNHPGTSIQLGKESIIDARNNTGAAIANGSAVYISGALGQHPTITLARANSEATSLCIGLVTHEIANNATGKVTVLGSVGGLNTSAFADGAALYLSASTAGALTTTPPASPNLSILVGYVTHSHVSEGQILVYPKQTISNNNTLGTSQSIPPSENAVREYVSQALSEVQIDQAGGTGSVYGVLAGAINGSNTDFTVSEGVYSSGKLIISLNGQIQTQGVDQDWIELNPAGGTFRFNIAPPVSSVVMAEYGKSSVVAGAVLWGSILGGNPLVQADLATLLSQKAPLSSPNFTDVPTAPTASPGTNTTQLATTAFVTAAVAAAGGGGSPTVQAIAWSSGGNIDYSAGTVFSLTANSTGTLTSSNNPTNGQEYSFRLYLTISSGTFTKPTAWSKGDAVPTTTVGSYVITGATIDGGTSFFIAVLPA